jgi:antitoxin ParD1/3/4|tara:strand:- start:186 stop:344 length:159 start_codon:yes stop_codon:yes gene_type:complete
VVRAGLRALEDNESKILALRQMLMDGDKSGPADYSYETLIAELDRERRESKE